MSTTSRTRLERPVLEPQLGQDDHSQLVDPPAERVAHRLGLFEDLLEQEMRIPVLLRLLRLPVDGHDARLDRGAVELLHGDPVRCRGDDLALTEQRDALGVRDERGDVTAHEDLAPSEPDDERRVDASAHDPIGLVGGDHDERARAVHAVERAAHRGREVAVELVLDEMGDDLRVGLAEELVTARHELGAQLAVVLDDAVVDDVDPPGAVLVRMRVLDRGAAVRRPSGMADAHRAGRGALRLDLEGEVGDLVRVLDGADVTGRVDDRDAGGVVAAVLEPAQAVEQDWRRGTGAGVADDAAHGTSLERRRQDRVTRGESGLAWVSAVASAVPPPRRSR